MCPGQPSVQRHHSSQMLGITHLAHPLQGLLPCVIATIPRADVCATHIPPACHSILMWRWQGSSACELCHSKSLIINRHQLTLLG